MKKLEDIKTYSIGKILDEPLPEINWIVGGMFAKGDLVLFYGKSGSMKSFLLIDMGLHLACGKPWLGHHIKKPAKIYYIDEEMGEIRTKQRIQRVAKANDFRAQGEQFVLTTFNSLKMQKDDMTEIMKAYQRDYHCMPDVVIIETVRRTMIGDENSAQDVNRMWEAVNPLKQIGTTVIISHHTRKDSDDVESGSGYLRGGVDTAFSVQKKQGEDLITVKHQKARDNRGDKPLKVIAKDHGPYETDPISFHLAEGEDKQKKDEVETAILRYLVDQPDYASRSKPLYDYLGELGYSRSNSERKVNSLAKQGIIYTPSFGVWALKTPSEVVDGLSDDE